MSVDFNPSNLRRKSVTKDMNGNIINWLDEADGGWIIRNRQIVNQAKFDSYVQKERDKQTAAQASSEQVSASREAEALRAGKILSVPAKTDDTERRLNEMESKLDAILSALNKK